ncbi:MAG: alpha-E domain-containing protein [Firmicutes bacterium]|nr:alpha-E domain-containing protein [Bacillota bacterium]
MSLTGGSVDTEVRMKKSVERSLFDMGSQLEKFYNAALFYEVDLENKQLHSQKIFEKVFEYHELLSYDDSQNDLRSRHLATLSKYMKEVSFSLKTSRSYLSKEFFECLNSLCWSPTLLFPDLEPQIYFHSLENISEIEGKILMGWGILDTLTYSDTAKKLILLSRHMERIRYVSYLLYSTLLDDGELQYTWKALLDLLSSADLYVKKYSLPADIKHIAELLVFDRNFPGSIDFSLRLAKAYFDSIADEEYVNEGDKVYHVDQIFADGLALLALYRAIFFEKKAFSTEDLRSVALGIYKSSLEIIIYITHEIFRSSTQTMMLTDRERTARKAFSGSYPTSPAALHRYRMDEKEQSDILIKTFTPRIWPR